MWQQRRFWCKSESQILAQQLVGENSMIKILIYLIKSLVPKKGSQLCLKVGVDNRYPLAFPQ